MPASNPGGELSHAQEEPHLALRDFRPRGGEVSRCGARCGATNGRNLPTGGRRGRASSRSRAAPSASPPPPPAAPECSGRSMTVAHFRAGKAIGDGRDRHSILVRHMGVSLVVTATNNTYSCSTRLQLTLCDAPAARPWPCSRARSPCRAGRGYVGSWTGRPCSAPEHLLVAHRTTRRLSNCREASAS
jgi:hypothetical protein